MDVKLHVDIKLFFHKLRGKTPPVTSHNLTGPSNDIFSRQEEDITETCHLPPSLSSLPINASSTRPIKQTKRHAALHQSLQTHPSEHLM